METTLAPQVIFTLIALGSILFVIWAIIISKAIDSKQLKGGKN
jgi:hypothetical protein